MLGFKNNRSVSMVFGLPDRDKQTLAIALKYAALRRSLLIICLQLERKKGPAVCSGAFFVWLRE